MKSSDLIGRTNAVIGNLNGVQAENILKVYRSKCCHYYGTQAWQFQLNPLKDFTVMWNRCVRRLLCLPNMTHSRFLPHISGMCTPHDQICNSFLKMLSNMRISDNELVRYMSQRSYNPNSIIGGNLKYIQRHYGLPKTIDCTCKHGKLTTDTCNLEDLVIISLIKELLFDNVILSKIQCISLLNYLCII